MRTLSLQGLACDKDSELVGSYSDVTQLLKIYCHMALKCLCERAQSAQGVHIVPLAANHWNPKPRGERGYLLN